MSPETRDALRSAADDEFIIAFADALEDPTFSQDDFMIFVDEMHHRAMRLKPIVAERDVRRRAAIVLYEAPAASSSKN